MARTFNFSSIVALAHNVERMHRYFGGAVACAVMVYDALLATVPDY